MSFLQEYLGDAYKEDMSQDDLAKALEKVTKAREKQAEADLTKLKNAFNKASSDLAEYKHKLQAQMTEEDQKKAEQAELLEKLQAENAAFRKQTAIAENKAKFISFGYADDLAEKTAEALFDGDLETVFANHKAAWEAKEQEIRAGMMRNAPMPPAGNGNVSVSRESIMQIKDPAERQAQIAEHHDLFGY
jgi:nitrate/nitrite-specific signal transduction histidine kinase